MYENPSFQHKALVSLLISKVFYHLGEYNESLKYALGAGSLFEPTNESTFTNTILARAIDVYVNWVKQINYERVEFTTPNSFHHALTQLIEGISRLPSKRVTLTSALDLLSIVEDLTFASG